MEEPERTRGRVQSTIGSTAAAEILRPAKGRGHSGIAGSGDGSRKLSDAFAMSFKLKTPLAFIRRFAQEAAAEALAISPRRSRSHGAVNGAEL